MRGHETSLGLRQAQSMFLMKQMACKQCNHAAEWALLSKCESDSAIITYSSRNNAGCSGSSCKPTKTASGLLCTDKVASSLCAGGYFVATVPDSSRRGKEMRQLISSDPWKVQDHCHSAGSFGAGAFLERP